MPPSAPGEIDCDVAIVGGALAGAASALLLLKARPELNVFILEKSPAFGRRVGEASVEVSGYFLGRMLGLTQHSNESHLVKQGMRSWWPSKNLRPASAAGLTVEESASTAPLYPSASRS